MDAYASMYINISMILNCFHVPFNKFHLFDYNVKINLKKRSTSVQSKVNLNYLSNISCYYLAWIKSSPAWKCHDSDRANDKSLNRYTRENLKLDPTKLKLWVRKLKK